MKDHLNERNNNSRNNNQIKYHVELERPHTGSKLNTDILALSPPHLAAVVKLTYPGWRIANSIAIN